jgi:hypothetical protein
MIRNERRLAGVLLCVTASLSLTACRQGGLEQAQPPSQPVDATTQKREDEFRLKERCAADADRFDKLFAPKPGAQVETSVSEVFYSPVRNSCMCEVSAVGRTGKAGALQNMLTLYDCLTREEVGTTMLDLNGDWQSTQEAWKRDKEKLKAVPR